MSNAPLVTNAKQTAATNVAAYSRNRRPHRAGGGTPPVPAPGPPASHSEAIRANADEPVRVRAVGVLMGLASDAEAKACVEGFEQGLERAGWSVGHKLRIEYRYAEGGSARMQALAQELVELKPDCVLGQSIPITDVLMRATRTIPIVFVAVSDPIGSGFVASMARPGGNITGFTVLHASIAGRYFALLIQTARLLARLAV